MALILRRRRRFSSYGEAPVEALLEVGTRVDVCVRIRDRVENGRLAPDHTHGSTV